MNDIATETVFLNEVSAFLSSNDVHEILPEVEQHIQLTNAGTSGTDGSSSTATIDKPTSKHLTPRQKEVLRKKRYERRLKKERETLRNMVSELTTQLTLLKRGRRSKQHDTVDPVATDSVWRALTIVRHEERHRAEEEQRRLEAAIDDQSTYLATLRALIPKHLYDWVAITEATRAAIVSSRQANMQANHILFAEHLRQVFAAYARVDEVFSDINVLTLADGMAASKADGAVEYFRHFNKCTLPFSFKQTHEAWWNRTNLNQWLQDGDGYAKLADPNDTVILRVRLVRTLPTGMTMSVMQRYILRRFVNETQAVFMWKTYSEGEGPFTGMYLEETGWARLQPSTEEVSTIVAVCVHQAPMQLDASKPHTAEDQQFYNVMQNLLKENAEAIMMLLTNKLLEDTLAPIDIAV